nr:PAS domain S-box protein [uncultured Methanobacterium sp.]
MQDSFDSHQDLSIYKSIFETSLDAILITKDDGSVLAANPMARELFGMTQEEIISGVINGLIVQNEVLKTALIERSQKGSVTAELTFKRKDGSTFTGDVISAIFTDNGVVKANMIIRDIKCPEIDDNNELTSQYYYSLVNGIAQRKKHEKAIKDSEIKYSNLFETMAQGVVFQNSNGHIISMNPAAEKIMGYTLDEIENRTSDDPIWQSIHEDNTPFPGETHPSMVALKTGQEIKNVVMGIKNPSRDGYTWLNINAIPEFRNGEEKPYQVYTTFEDITNRKKIEDDLKRHAILLDLSNEAIFSWDYEYGILSWNQGAERLYGYNSSEAVGSVSHELLKTEFPIEFNEFMEKLDTNKSWTGELIHKRKDGKKITVESNMQVIKDINGKKIVIESNRDITERKQVEIELKETLDNLEEKVEERTTELRLAHDYNRNLIETALDPLVTIGPDGTITDVNKATENVTGYLRKELVGTDFADYFTEPEEAKKGYQQVFQYGLVRDYPLEIRHKDGTLTPVLYNASVYRDESGEVVGVFAAARDVTERKKAEKELREYWENLEEQVKLRTEELAKSNADLKQFTYVASHDLREPLRMITTFLQLLDRRYKTQLDDDARDFIDFAVDGAKRLDKMIVDLLEYSRITNKEMMFSEVDFKEVMDQVNLNLNVVIHENNADITYDLPQNVRADENQMIILLQNLIGNAIKYRSEKKPKIHVSAKQDGNFIVFKVKDNGIGMDSKYLKRIFTIFQRLHNHQEYEGSGIGLSIAQRIVHQHGGEIWVESELGKGSTFYFTIKI